MLAKLQVLNLSGVNLKRSSRWLEAINMLPSLFELRLDYCHLYHILPNLQINFTSLASLDLQGNFFSSTIPPWLFNITNIEFLDLSYNSFSGFIPEEIENTKFLRVLDLSGNALQGKIPKNISNLCNLREFSVNKNRISGDISNIIHGSLPSFSNPQIYERHIFLDSNKFDGPLPIFYGDVTVLDLSDNLLSGYIPQSIGYMMPELFILRVSNNKFIGTLPESLCQMESLRVLDVSKNQLTGKLPECWNSSERLTVIDASENSFSGQIPWSLGSIPSLQSIHLQENKFLGELPESLKNLTNLQTLDIGHNAFYGVIPSWLGENLASLRFLSLESNNFAGEIPLQLCNLNALQLLNLAQNNLNGTIPHCFRNFTSMIVGTEALEQKNAPQGEIPKSLSKLCNLHEFYSSENRIRGDISNILGSSSTCALRSLELSSLNINELTGTTTKQLQRSDSKFFGTSAISSIYTSSQQ
ncbi:Leucine-rich repeat [Dillenia turbinata]|uniref:Leucine-rich repeat n=1 Tax=Dillenia turbinata TaxID=194707 RepID=A0AAN8VKZ4_9MAGN